MGVGGGCIIILIIIDVDFIDMSVLVCCGPSPAMGKPTKPFNITLWNSLAACMPLRVVIPPITDTDIDKHIQHATCDPTCLMIRSCLVLLVRSLRP